MAFYHIPKDLVRTGDEVVVCSPLAVWVEVGEVGEDASSGMVVLRVQDPRTCTVNGAPLVRGDQNLWHRAGPDRPADAAL